MNEQIQKLDAATQKYTDHAYLHATLMAVAGIFTLLTFVSPVIA